MTEITARRSSNRTDASTLILSSFVLMGILSAMNIAQAQNMNPPSTGQMSTAPSAAGAPGSSNMSSNSSMSSPMNSSPNTSSAARAPVTAPITAPVNTVGNTPSSVSRGGQGSGYSASGSTVNSNINNTQVGGRSAGAPIGNGANASRGYGGR